jgi:RimJ/RimL family protein N-acetyltransferase
MTDDDAAIRIRRATADDVDFLVGLVNDEDVEPYLATAQPRDGDGIAAEIERSSAEPQAFGRFIVEVREDAGWERAGAMAFEVRSTRSRIARLGGLAVHPRFRGRRLADEAARILQRHLLLDLGYHRLELEIYGFNERAIRHAERSGFVREGVRRKAHSRHGAWVDGVLFGLIREDVDRDAAG